MRMRSIRYDELQHAIHKLSKNLGAIFLSYRIVGAPKVIIVEFVLSVDLWPKIGIEEDNVYM